jgi:hypothetical protein
MQFATHRTPAVCNLHPDATPTDRRGEAVYAGTFSTYGRQLT